MTQRCEMVQQEPI